MTWGLSKMERWVRRPTSCGLAFRQAAASSLAVWINMRGRLATAMWLLVRISETTGTVLTSVRCVNQFDPTCCTGICQGPAFSHGLYYQMACGEISANYLEWCRRQLPTRPDFDRLMELAGQTEPGAGGLRLRTGLALTANAAATRLEKVFEGLTPNHTQGDMVRCIMEAVASALREQVAALSGGVLPAEIRSVGSSAQRLVAANQGQCFRNTRQGDGMPRADKSGRGHIGRGRMHGQLGR